MGRYLGRACAVERVGRKGESGPARVSILSLFLFFFFLFLFISNIQFEFNFNCELFLILNVQLEANNIGGLNIFIFISLIFACYFSPHFNFQI
jgi:hypothetical protein